MCFIKINKRKECQGSLVGRRLESPSLSEGPELCPAAAAPCVKILCSVPYRNLPEAQTPQHAPVLPLILRGKLACLSSPSPASTHIFQLPKTVVLWTKKLRVWVFSKLKCKHKNKRYTV